jgi:hypothetical protein
LKKFFLALLATAKRCSLRLLSFVFWVVISVAFFCVGILLGLVSAVDVQDMRKGGTLKPFFAVVVRHPSENNRLVPVLLSNLAAYRAAHPDSTLVLQASNGRGDGWFYSLMPASGANQRVRFVRPGNTAIEMEYETRGETAYPLYSKATTWLYIFFGYPLGLLLAWLVNQLPQVFRRWRSAQSPTMRASS